MPERRRAHLYPLEKALLVIGVIAALSTLPTGLLPLDLPYKTLNAIMILEGGISLLSSLALTAHLALVPRE